MIDSDVTDLEGDGEWGEVIDDALIAVHSMVLPNGKVLAFGTDGTSGNYDARFVYSLYDPETGEITVLPNTTGTNIFCSNMSIDPTTGNVIIMGGDNHNTGEGSGTWSGINDVVVFDYETETIRNLSEEDSSFAMEDARWYGTTINLSSGEILILGGRDEDFNGSTTVEIYNSESGMRTLSGITIPDMTDGDGTLTGTYYYPHVWQTSDGSVIMIESGGTSDSGHDVYRLDIEGEGSIQQIGTLPFDTRNLTGSIMYDVDQVLVASDNGQVWKADLSADVITWEIAFTIYDEDDPEDAIARTNGTFVMMPDGTVAIVGGSSSSGLLGDSLGNAQKTVYFWDPDTGEVTYSEQQDLARMYHSSALLLPTGEIYSAGSGSPGPQENANAQVLTPSYLFEEDGTQVEDRPVILGAPSNVDSGSNFRITVDDTSDISMISFVKTGASTHARTADIRFLELEYTVIDENTIEITMPDANVAIPGTWMLFVLDEDGTPSVANVTGVDMVDLVDTGASDSSSAMVYAIDDEQIDGAFALAVTARFDDLNGADSQTIFELLDSSTGAYIKLAQIGETDDIEFVIYQNGETYRVVAEDVIVEGELATWRVGVDAEGVMRIMKDSEVLVESDADLNAIPEDIDRDTYLVGETSASDSEFIGLIRDLKIANYGNFAELDPTSDASPCVATGEAVCLCDFLVPDVDDTEGNDAAVVFDDYSILQGDVSELQNGSSGENSSELYASGIVAFADADTTDTHTATVTPLGDDYVGSLTISSPSTTSLVKTGSITWDFAVNDADLDALEEGESVVQNYEIAITDSAGEVTTTTVSVTLNGSDDSVPEEEDYVVVDNIDPTSGDDDITLGDNIRLMNGDYFETGSNSFTVGNYFELREGNLDFDNSDDFAYMETGLRPRLFGGDIRMDEGGITNTLILGNVAEFSLIKMDGDGANTRNSVTIGNSSKSDAMIDMDSSGTAADLAQIDLNIGNVVEIGGKIDADGNYAARDFDFGYLVTVHGDMDLGGNTSSTNDVKIGQGFTLEGDFIGSGGVDTVEIGKDWDIDGTVNLYGGDDTLILGETSVDTTANDIYGGAGEDTLVLDVDTAEMDDFAAAATEAGWVQNSDGTWNANGEDLTWKGTTFHQFEIAQINEIGVEYAPEIIADDTVATGSVTELSDDDADENAMTHLVNGTIAFTDQDNIGGVHTVEVTAMGDDYVGELQYTQPKSAQFGLWPWVFAVDDADIDDLDEGEVLTQTYQVTFTDESGLSVTENVVITITGTDDTVVVDNNAPLASDDTVSDDIVADTAIEFDAASLLSNDSDADGDTLQVVSVDATSDKGASVTLVDTDSDGVFDQVKYDPTSSSALSSLAEGETATDTFSYTIQDEAGETSTAEVTVTVTGAADDVVDPVNTDPDAVDDTVYVILSADQAVSASMGLLLNNDSDADGDNISVQSVEAFSERGAAISLVDSNGDGTFDYITYDPTVSDELSTLDEGVTVSDVVTYTISDGNGGTDTATISLTIAGTASTGDNGTGDNGTGDNGTGDNGTGDNGGDNSTDADGLVVDDVAGTVQYLQGTDNTDKFVIDGVASDYAWETFDDEGSTATLVYNVETGDHDLMYEFEQLEFTDQTVNVGNAAGTTDPSEGLVVEDIAGSTQYLNGTDNKDTFIIEGDSSAYAWETFDDDGSKATLVYNTSHG